MWYSVILNFLQVLGIKVLQSLVDSNPPPFIDISCWVSHRTELEGVENEGDIKRNLFCQHGAHLLDSSKSFSYTHLQQRLVSPRYILRFFLTKKPISSLFSVKAWISVFILRRFVCQKCFSVFLCGLSFCSVVCCLLKA